MIEYDASVSNVDRDGVKNVKVVFGTLHKQQAKKTILLLVFSLQNKKNTQRFYIYLLRITIMIFFFTKNRSSSLFVPGFYKICFKFL